MTRAQKAPAGLISSQRGARLRDATVRRTTISSTVSAKERKRYRQNAPKAGHASHRKPDSHAEAAPNADLRTREYLTEAEIEKLMEAAKGNRWGCHNGGG